MTYTPSFAKNSNPRYLNDNILAAKANVFVLVNDIIAECADTTIC